MLEAVKKLLGTTHYSFTQKSESSPIKIELLRLKTGRAANFSDSEKIKLLLDAETKLNSSGFEANAKISQKDLKSDTYIPWPHLWVKRAPVKENNREPEIPKPIANEDYYVSDENIPF